jgi:hypothetical protein
MPSSFVFLSLLDCDGVSRTLVHTRQTRATQIAINVRQFVRFELYERSGLALGAHGTALT